MSKNQYVDFSDTEIAFVQKTDRELKRAIWLFRMMNHSWLVDILAPLASVLIRWKIPLVKSIVKATIFEQFVGGETLHESLEQIEKLARRDILTILDYGAEGKTTEKQLDHAHQQFMDAITFAASNESVAAISVKISALSSNDILAGIQAGRKLTDPEQNRYLRVRERIDTLCNHAFHHRVKIFFDAEESWIQDTIDELVDEMMAKYNQEMVIVYTTFQMYRHDRLDFLHKSYEKAQRKGYILGAKLVRGAYMEKERERAEEMGYPSPIHQNKSDTDRDFNAALRFCVDHFERLASCVASHNEESCLLQAKLIAEKKLPRSHHHLNFCQLVGMSDHITYNLAENGFNTAKYVVFGSVEEVLPYLTRRAEENSAVSGEFGREYKLLLTEARRRGL